MKETIACNATDPNVSFSSIHQESLTKAKFNFTYHSLTFLVVEFFLVCPYEDGDRAEGVGV
jgi:hypothetical protein